MIQATPSYGASIYSAISTQSSTGTPSPANEQATTANRTSQQQSIQDTVTLSRQGIRQAGNTKKPEEQSTDSNEPKSSEPTGKDGEVLTQQEQQQLRQLKLRDVEVKAHEQAHLSVAGQYAAGGASFSYETGPDGVKYAVGGEVPIDVGKEESPEATILKMQTVKRAALAPANPSSTDRMIAAQADQKAAQARQEMMREQNNEAQDLLSSSSTLNAVNIGNSETQTDKPSTVEGATRKTLAINTYNQIASMIQ